jgi:uncharacterized GH25 family protein
MKHRNSVPVISMALLLLAVGLAYSHDVWLFPDRFVLAKGETLTVRQLAGTELRSEHDLALLRTMTPRFELITPEGTIDLLAGLPDMRTRPEIRPVLERRLDFEGLALVVMDHAFIWEEWTPERFLEYLEHEEFEVEKLRPHMGRGAVERERYARNLKTLVRVGRLAVGDLHRRPIGQKLEILLLQNPYLLDPGDDLDVQILFDGKPLPDKLVMAFHGDEGRPVDRSFARTDAAGIARFRLGGEGPWLIRLVHLLPCAERPEVDCGEVDWESYWSSFSFWID